MTCGGRSRRKASSASLVTRVPVGLFGEARKIRRVCGVTARSIAGRSGVKSTSSTTMARTPKSWAMSV